LQIGRCAKTKDVMMADKHTLSVPRTLIVYYTKIASTPTPGIPKPITIQVPAPFPYKDNKAVPWRYDAEVCVDGNTENPSPVMILDNSVTNIAGIGGIARSDRIYTLEELQREETKEVVKDNKKRWEN